MVQRVLIWDGLGARPLRTSLSPDALIPLLQPGRLLLELWHLHIVIDVVREGHGVSNFDFYWY